MNVELPKHCSQQVFDSTRKDNLTELYTELYKVSRSDLVMSTCYMQFSSAKVNGKKLGTHNTHTTPSSIAIATWNNGFSNVPGPTVRNTVCRVVRTSQHNVFNSRWTKQDPFVGLPFVV